MHARWWLSLSCLALLGWHAARPSEAWGRSLDPEPGDSRPLVLLVASAAQPLGAQAIESVDQVWRERAPRARRVLLERADPRIGRPSRLALCVFEPQGQLVARRDGPLSAAAALEWLPIAIEAARDESRRREQARSDPRAAFDDADRALALGARDAAQRGFAALALATDAQLRAQASERLARVALESGDVAEARLQLARALAGCASARHAARVQLTRGLLEFASREHAAAAESLAGAAAQREALGEAEFEQACMALARAQAACGEETRAIATLEALARTSSSRATGEAARALAESLCTPSLSPTH